MERNAADAPPTNPRWLVMLVAIMGVLIAVGVAVIAVEIARRLFTPPGPKTEAAVAGPATVPAAWQAQIEVTLPAGARVVDSHQAGQHLHLRLQLADGGTAIWLVDLASGRVASRVTFAAAR